jgi:hypothetical protein
MLFWAIIQFKIFLQLKKLKGHQQNIPTLELCPQSGYEFFIYVAWNECKNQGHVLSLLAGFFSNTTQYSNLDTIPLIRVHIKSC